MGNVDLYDARTLLQDKYNIQLHYDFTRGRLDANKEISLFKILMTVRVIYDCLKATELWFCRKLCS
mgnify:CR=1 FL=1